MLKIIFISIGIAVFGQGLFQSVLLLFIKNVRQYKLYILSTILILLSFSVLEYALIWSEKIYYFPHLLGYTFVFQFLFPPLIYLYFKHGLSMHTVKPLYSEWYHFLPFVLVLFYQFNFFISPVTQKLHFYENGILDFSFFNSTKNIVVSLTSILQSSLYIFLLWKSNFTDLKALHTIKKLLSLYLLASILYVFSVLFGSHFIVYACASISLITISFIYYISFIALKRDDVFVAKKSLRYQNSRLKEEEVQSILLKLKDMEESKDFFLNNTMTLDDLANQIGFSKHKLSRVLNENIGFSFNQYVNKNRVDYAKKLIEKSNGDVSLKEIVYDSGFNNKTSFNDAFKKHALMTASDYAKTVREKS